MSEKKKVRVGLDWLAVCSGCEISLLDLHERLLTVLDAIDIVYCPVLMDVKKVPEVDVFIVTGALRNKENREKIEEIRKKCKILIAMGSCATHGGVPGLANVYTNDYLWEVYHVRPNTVELLENVQPLDEVVKVDYYIPGCAPPADTIFYVLSNLLAGKEIKYSMSTVCDECERERKEKKIETLKPLCSIETIDPKACLLEQGIFCAGPATMAGCGALCPKSSMGCRGCFGPPQKVLDQGAKLISAIAPICEKPELIKDPLGHFYRQTLAKSLLKGRIRKRGRTVKE